MGKRKSIKGPATGAAICRTLCDVGQKNLRAELAIEELIDIAVPMLRKERLDKEVAVPVDLVHRYWAVSYAGYDYGEPPHSQFEEEARKRSTAETWFLWEVLRRIHDFAADLAGGDASGRWLRLRDLIKTWEDAWGDGSKNREARLCFGRMTRTQQRGADMVTYLHRTLADALEDSHG